MKQNNAGMKKVLVLGGKPIGSCELVNALHEHGAYVIVADYLDPSASPAKKIADESWNISTADIDELKNKCLDSNVSAVLAGVHEFNIEKMAELSEALGTPCYCTSKQQEICINKSEFKKWCVRFGLPIAREYNEEAARSLQMEEYPLAVKPSDGSGSRGFTKCETPNELENAIITAKKSSPTGRALIEEYLDAEALIAHYTMKKGKAYYSGLADKLSLKAGEFGAPIMAMQIAPSLFERDFLDLLNEKIKDMLEAIGMKEGPVWIELFHSEDRFILNEIGYRFGGSMTNYLVKELTGIDQMELLVASALSIDLKVPPSHQWDGLLRAIYPIHLKPGRISAVDGIDRLKNKPYYVAHTQVHWEGDLIEDWGSAQQVFMYLHLKAKCCKDLLSACADVLSTLTVLDENNNEMLYALFDPTEICAEKLPFFITERLKTEHIN